MPIRAFANPNHLTFIASGIDREGYRAMPFYADGQLGPAIELRSFSRSFSTKLRKANDGRSASPLQPQRATGITILTGGL
jgi:hypothetical protein